MADGESHLGSVVSVRDLDEGKMVNVEISEPEALTHLSRMRDNLMGARARGRAIVGAGLAKEGYVRDPDLALKIPDIERRTDIVSKQQIDDDLWNYEIKVRSGFVLE